jgi:hypothetical protein
MSYTSFSRFRENWGGIILFLLAITVISCFMVWVLNTPRPQSERDDSDAPYPAPTSGMRIYHDNLTGCEYLTAGGSMLIRMASKFAVLRNKLMNETIDDALIRLAKAEGYTDVRIVDGDVRGIYRFMFTYAIISGIDRYGYSGRWCYEDYATAIKSLNNWHADEKEPYGWHRHPDSGRRRPNGDATKQFISR